MSAPQSVWVLVWPDGFTGGTYDSYEHAHEARVECEAHNAVVTRYDLAASASASPQVASALKPPASPTACVVPVSQHGPVAVPAGDGGDHEQHDSRAA